MEMERANGFGANETRDAVGNAMAGHTNAVAKNYTADSTFACSSFDPNDYLQIPLIYELSKKVWEKLGFPNWFKGRDPNKGRLVVKAIGTSTDTVEGVIGFKEEKEGGGQETEEEKNARARIDAISYVEESTWQSFLACGMVGGGEEEIVHYSEHQKAAIVELIMHDVRGGEDGKNVSLQMACGMGKSTPLMAMAIMKMHEIEIGGDKSMRFPIVLVVPNRNLADDKFEECQKLGLRVVKVMGGEGESTKEVMMAVNRVLLNEGNVGEWKGERRERGGRVEGERRERGGREEGGRREE